jgi:hypothetical protein
MTIRFFAMTRGYGVIADAAGSMSFSGKQVFGFIDYGHDYPLAF